MKTKLILGLLATMALIGGGCVHVDRDSDRHRRSEGYRVERLDRYGGYGRYDDGRHVHDRDWRRY